MTVVTTLAESSSQLSSEHPNGVQEAVGACLARSPMVREHEMVNLDTLITAAVRGSLSDVAFSSGAASLGVSREEMFNRFALEVGRRFLDDGQSYSEASRAMARLMVMMVGDFSKAPDRTYRFPEPAYSVCLAFDAGEYDLHDGVDRVEQVTKPELRRILASA